MKQVLALAGALGAALAASACCILPAVLGAGAVGTLGLGAALMPLRPYLLVLTLLLLGAAFYFALRPARAACDAAGHCEPGATNRRFNKAVLWVFAPLTVAAMAYPTVSGLDAAGSTSSTASRGAESASTPAAKAKAVKTAVFTVGNMTCASCTTGIAQALRKVPGVAEARVDFESKRATVRYDAARAGVPQLRAAIEQQGFSARERRS